MWNWATPGERARRAVWVMYKRLTATRLHKFYTLTALLTFLPLLTLHLLALHNTSTGLTKLSTLLSFTSPSSSTSNSNSNSNSSSSNNSWEGSGSLVPTVIQQDGQGVLRICNLRRDVCESVTAVALSATVSTPTPTFAPITPPPPSSSSPAPSSPAPSSQAAGSGGIAGDEGASILSTRTIPASSTPPASRSPDVVVQAGPTTRPPPTDSQPTTTTTTSSSSSSLVVPSLAISSQPSQPSPSPNFQAPSPPISQAPSPPNFQASSSVSSVQGDGVLIAAPPPPTPSASSTVPDVPLVVPTTSTSASTSLASSSTSSTSTSTTSSEKSKDGNSKQGGSRTSPEAETSSTTSGSTPTLTSTSTSISSTTSSSPTPTISESSTENDATDNKAPSPTPSTSTSTSTSNRAVSSTDSAVDGHGGPSGHTSTSTTSSSSTSISTSSSSRSTSTSTAPTSTSTDTTSTSSTSPDVDLTESPVGVPTSSSSSESESTPPQSDKGGVEGGNGGSTSTTSSTSTSTSTSTTLTTTSNSDEATPIGTTSTDSTPTDSTQTGSRESKESSTVEPSSSSADDEPTSASASTSTPTSSGVPKLKRALPLRRRYTETLYGSPGSAFPAQLQPRTSSQLQSRASSTLQSRAFSTLQTRAFSALYPRTFSATPITNGTNGALEGVDVTDVSDSGGDNVTRLGVVCAISMAFPLSQLRQDWIEDITMAAFYLCILGVGIAAIINESVAHLITAILSTLLSVLWTSTQLVRTHYAHDQFDAFITRSACSGVDVLPYYWSQRQRVELPILIINVLALVLLAGLGFKLLKMYREDSNVRRYVYKVMLVLRCSILLGSFFLLSGTGIWLNFLFTDPGVVVSGTVNMLKGLAIVSLVFGLPWAATGWFALREAESLGGRSGKWLGKRMMMGVFVCLTVLFLAGWVATFASDVYRAVFLAWTFFAVVSVAAFFVLVGSLGAGVVCWMRFGRDLDEFDSEKPRGVSVVSTESFGNPAGHLSHSSGGGGGGGGGGSLEVPRWDYSNTAEKAWEPFDKASIRQSQFTASDGRQSTVFSYGLRSPAPPVPMRPDTYGSSSNPSVAFGLAL